jgi:RNA polymerase sigma factor (sigma-70 family)
MQKHTPEEISDANDSVIAEIMRKFDEVPLANIPRKLRSDPARVARLVEINQQLVPWFIEKTFPWAGEALREELIQEGYVGLLTAARKYNPFLGVLARGEPYKFSTLAVPLMLQRTLQQLSTHDLRKSLILPQAMSGKSPEKLISALETRMARLIERYEHEEITHKNYSRWKQGIEGAIRGIRMAQMPPIYLGQQRRYFDHTDEVFRSSSTDVPDERADVVAHAERADLESKVDDVVNSISKPGNRIAVALRFGLSKKGVPGVRGEAYERAYNMAVETGDGSLREKIDAGDELSYPEVGLVLGISGPAANKRVESALQALRHPSRTRKLGDFWDAQIPVGHFMTASGSYAQLR